MDPQVEEMVAYARSKGYNDQEIQARLAGAGIEWSPETPITAGNLARSAVQGASFNLADNALGMLPEWLGGGEAAAEDMRAKDAAFRKDHKGVATAAEIAGGLVMPGGLAAKLAGKGVGTARAILGGATAAGASGALAGAGAADGGTMGDRAKAAVAPGVISFALGGLIPGGVAGVRALRPAARAADRLATATKRAGGVQGLTAKLDEFAAAGRGQDVALADLSPSMRQAADFAANNNEEAFDQIGKVAYGRQTDASERILGDVTGPLGNPQANEIIEELASDTRKWAKSDAGFQGLRDANPVIAPQDAVKFGKLLNSERVNDVWAQAQELQLIGTKPPEGPISFSVLQGTKERLDAAVDAAYGKGIGDLGSRLADARDELVEEMRQSVPGYQKVAAEYAERKGRERMVAAGQEAFNTADSRGLAKQVGGMKPADLQRFREGMVSELITKLRSASTNRDLAKQLVDASPAMQDKLKVAFGSGAAFDDFTQKTGVERELSKLLRVLGGADTHRRGAAAGSGGIDGLELVADAASAPLAPWSAMSQVAGQLRRGTLGRVANKTAGHIGPTLATKGEASLRKLLAEWEKHPMRPLVGAAASRGLPVGLGAGIGGLLGD
jgi:hypothetical protein